MGKLVILFFCLAIFEIATALQCYKCEKCTGAPTTWEKITCGTSGIVPQAGNEWACLRLNYKDRVTYKDAEDRKCVLAEKKNGKLSFGCPTSQGEPQSCPVCQTDFCNSSAATIKYSFVALASIVLAVVVPKYL